jgi:glycosyltransferase involved in cell wall biosynthesis
VGKGVDIPNTSIQRIPRVSFVDNVPIGPSLVKIFLDILIFITAVRLIIVNWGEYDTVHTHEEAALIGVVLTQISGLQLVYDMHSSMPQQLENFNFTSNSVLIKIFNHIERICIEKAELVIVICSHLESTVKRIDPNANVYLIENTPLATEDTEEQLTAADLQKRYDLDDRPTIVYTGTFEEYQGIDMVVKSAATVNKQIDTFRYILVGGEPEQVNNMRQLAQKEGVNNVIEFTGRRPIEEMPAFRELADILISPRVSGTNTPLKIYSYLKSGTPIVATDVYSHTQVLSSEVAELTEPEPSAFGEGIVRLLTNNDQGRDLAENAMHLAEEEYSQDVFESKHRSAYGSIDI